MPTIRRGIIFSLDALLAAVLLSLFAASIAYFSSRAAEDSMGDLLLRKQSSDLLLSMDKSGLLSGTDRQRMGMTLNAALPPEMGYALYVDYYSYNYSTSSFSPMPNESYSAVNGVLGKNAGKVASQRDFVVASRGQPPIFGVARLELFAG